MTRQPSRLRVLDLTDDLALGAGRLLVGMGCDVIRVETTSSCPAPAAEALHWHAGKRVARVAGDGVDELVARLLPGADVVLESGPVRSLITPGLREADPSAWEHVVQVLVTPFGLTGPYADWLADDTVASAAGGMAWLGGDPDEPPVPTPRQQATQLAGTHAVVAAQLALLARSRTGRGQLAEVSVQEAVAGTLETGAIAWLHAGTVPGRTGGVYGHVAHRVFATSDGHVAGGWSGPERMWTDLLDWLVEEDAAGDLTDPIWADPVHRWQHRDHVDRAVAAFVATRTTAEVAEAGRERALPWAAVARPRDLIDNPQLLDRDFLVTIESDDHGEVWDVGFPYRAPHAPAQLRAPEPTGPEVDWHDRGSATASAPVARRRSGDAHREPMRALDGLRVLDLTWVLAGPYLTKALAEHGATVVKVESRHRQDPTRFSPSMRLRPEAGPDDSGYFLNFNRNKRSLALNLRTDAGAALLRRLVTEVDVVVENFAPGVLAKWGIDYPRLRRLNPEVLLVSMAGVGSTGPWRRAVTFADTLAAMSGLTFETGTDGRPPQGLTFGLGDMVAANAALVATLDHLLAGAAGHIDLSQLEAMAAHLGTAALEHQLPRSEPTAVGPFVLPASGRDRWLAVGATGVGLLATALAAIDPAAATDPITALRDLSVRTPASDLAGRLQAAGVAAYPVQDGRDLVESDAQLAARGFYVEQQHPLAGPIRVEGLLEHLTETPGGVDQPAPLLGEHTDELLRELLGLAESEIADLHEKGILE